MPAVSRVSVFAVVPDFVPVVPTMGVSDRVKHSLQLAAE
jgi:hypothetical protein